MSAAVGTIEPDYNGRVIYHAIDRLRLVLSAIEAVENLPLKATNVVDVELDLRECLREVAERLREVADGGIGGGLLRLVRFEPSGQEEVEVAADLHDDSPSLGDSDVAPSVVDEPSVGVTPDTGVPSSPVSGALGVGDHVTASVLVRRGDDKEVEVFDGTILDVDADERLVLLRLDAGGWQVFRWGDVSRRA